MLNGQTILLQVFCILFVVASAFGQEESDSHIITVTKKIDVEKLNENVEDLNDSVKTLTETISRLDKTVGDLSTTVGDLKVTVARIDERTDGISKWQYVILAGIFGPLLLSVYDRYKKSNEGKTTSTNTAQANPSVGTTHQVPQAGSSEATPIQTTEGGENKDASTKVLQTDFSSRDKLTRYLKSEQHTTRRKV